jgi:putative ABC transport system substrate-binding protein
MNRRTFIGMGGLLAVPLRAFAQQQGKVYRVGVLRQGSPPLPGTPGILVVALRDFGYIEGQNLAVDGRYAEGKNERFPSLAVELVSLNIRCN